MWSNVRLFITGNQAKIQSADVALVHPSPVSFTACFTRATPLVYFHPRHIFATKQLFLNQAQLKPERVAALRKAVPDLTDDDVEYMQRCPYRRELVAARCGGAAE